MKIIRVVTSVFFFLIFLLLSACSSTGQLTSGWDSNSVTIDGNSTEWLSELKQDNENGIAYGFKNDNDFLYMCIVFIEPSKLMMMRPGAIVWLEGEEDSKTFGIRYPLPKLEAEGVEQNFGREIFNRENIKDRIQQFFLKQTEVSIVNKEKYPLGQFPITSNKEGIQAKVGYSNDRFVYELRVPLKNAESYLYRADVNPGEIITVKFETEEFELKETQNRGGMMPPGGGGGNGRRPTQGKGMEMRRERLNMEPLNFSVKVQLVIK